MDPSSLNALSLDPSKAPSSTAHSRSSSRAPNVRRQETEDSEKAGRVWAREAEDDAWAPCILTLDGGGIRGFSSLLILKALMHEVWLWEGRLDEEEAEEEEMRRGRGPAGGGAESTDEHREEGVDADQAEPTRRKTLTPEDELLPCHYFDFLYGTSTGGLIATILGRLRMTVPEALSLYRRVGDDLFGSRRSRIPLMTKYHHEPLERAVRSIVAARCHDHPDCDGHDLHPWPDYLVPETLAQTTPFDVTKPRLCQSCCLTATHDENISEAYLLRSYPHYYSPSAPNWITRYNEGADAIEIWKMARATTAAPFYFEMLHTVLDSIPKDFKDGGIRENNPSGAALSEFHSLYSSTDIESPALMLSVGTGRPDTTQDGFAAAWPGPLMRFKFVSKFLEKRAVLQNLLIKYTEGEKQHEMMRSHARGEHTWYKRLNVSEGLERMALDDWEKGAYGETEAGVEAVGGVGGSGGGSGGVGGFVGVGSDGAKKGNHVPGGASLTRMQEATEVYLKRGFNPAVDSYAPPGVMLAQAAEKMVRQRRAREREGGERWDIFVGRGLGVQKGPKRWGVEGEGVERLLGDEVFKER